MQSDSDIYDYEMEMQEIHMIGDEHDLSAESINMQGEHINVAEFVKQKKIFRKKALEILDIPKTLDETVIIVSFDIPIQFINLVAINNTHKRTPYALSIYINSKYMKSENITISEGCPLEVTKVTLPKRRNVFEIQSARKNNKGPLRFMEEFYIKLSDSGSDKTFYVACSNPSFETAGKNFRELRYPLYLTETLDEFCKFMCVSWDPMRNRTNDYITIEVTTRICHVTTNTFLSSQTDFMVPSFCGESYRVECCPDDIRNRSNTYWVICPDINSESSGDDDDI